MTKSITISFDEADENFLMALFDKLKVKTQANNPAESFSEVRHLEPLKGPKNFYRLRVGNYRIGLFWTGVIKAFKVK